LHPSGIAKSSTSFGWGKGWNATPVGWQVTLCDPIWHVSSSSGVATSVSELLHPCYFTLLYFTIIIAGLKRLSYLCWKERSEQRVEAAGTEVGDTEDDEREFLSSTHRSEAEDAAACFRMFFIARRSTVLHNRHLGLGQTDASRHRLTPQWRRPDDKIIK